MDKCLSVADIGKRIKQRRKKLGYTQAFVAEYTGLSASFISNVEQGKETAEIGKVLRLINVLGMVLGIEER